MTHSMYRRFFAVFVTALALAVTAPAFAQSVVGSSIVDGRKVELLSDGTWRYEDAATAGASCQTLPLNVSFCGVANGWTPTTPPAPDIAAQYRYDDRHYGQFIIEGLGSDDGMSMTFYQDAVLNNAAAATGATKSDIPVLDVRDETVAGHDGRTIVYLVNFDGLEVVFVNTVVVLPKRSIQTMTFSIGTEETERSRELHAAFLEQTKIE